jgi:peptidoglycan hydrolase FlgJ
LAISPPGDIVLDVARAADPAELEVARARLATRAGKVSENGIGSTFSVVNRAEAGTLGAKDAPPDTLVRFEAMVLQTFIQSMLPKDVDAVYGKGLAGDMWQSLLAEKLGDAVAERGGIGIADRLLRDYYLDGEKKVAIDGVSAGPEKATLNRRQMLTEAVVEEIQRKITQSLAQDQAAAASRSQF